MAFSDYDATAGNNTSIAGINIAENCSPANINNAIRQLMADAKAFANANTVSGSYQPLDASLTAYAALTTAADKGIYYTASDTPATYDLTSFGRTLGGLADYAALRTGLGAVTITASSLANPGYIKFNISGTNLMLQWGTGSIGANTTGTISYGQSFSTFAVCTVSGGPTGSSSEGDVHPTAASGVSSQAIVNSAPSTAFYSYFVIGV